MIKSQNIYFIEPSYSKSFQQKNVLIHLVLCCTYYEKKTPKTDNSYNFHVVIIVEQITTLFNYTIEMTIARTAQFFSFGETNIFHVDYIYWISLTLHTRT